MKISTSFRRAAAVTTVVLAVALVMAARAHEATALSFTQTSAYFSGGNVYATTATSSSAWIQHDVYFNTGSQGHNNGGSGSYLGTMTYVGGSSCWEQNPVVSHAATEDYLNWIGYNGQYVC